MRHAIQYDIQYLDSQRFFACRNSSRKNPITLTDNLEEVTGQIEALKERVRKRLTGTEKENSNRIHVNTNGRHPVIFTIQKLCFKTGFFIRDSELLRLSRRRN